MMGILNVRMRTVLIIFGCSVSVAVIVNIYMRASLTLTEDGYGSSFRRRLVSGVIFDGLLYWSV